jgi:hypothetical protein
LGYNDFPTLEAQSLFILTYSLLSKDVILPTIKVIHVISTNKHSNSQTPARGKETPQNFALRL